MSDAEPDARSITFDPIARAELAEAVAYYDQQREHLGDEFLTEVKHAVVRIRDFPNAWPQVSRRSKRCRVTRFPYGIIYQLLADEIRIIAVAHLRRRPTYWRRRE